METITVMDPTGQASSREFATASRLNDLSGRVLGILWNGKPNGDILLARLQETLVRRLGLASARLWQKPAVDTSAGALIADLAANADFIINGVGD
ncbi:MAG: hypothetical protein FWE89_01750 [Syntrophaceae bacterium]|nr:hypothetical protein [Syntrophaceae bacterium]